MSSMCKRQCYKFLSVEGGGEIESNESFQTASRIGNRKAEKRRSAEEGIEEHRRGDSV